MTSIPRTAPSEPMGIIIQNGKPETRPAVIWAYMWTADDEEAQDHWHQHVPVIHAA